MVGRLDFESSFRYAGILARVFVFPSPPPFSFYSLHSSSAPPSALPHNTNDMSTASDSDAPPSAAAVAALGRSLASVAVVNDTPPSLPPPLPPPLSSSAEEEEAPCEEEPTPTTGEYQRAVLSVDEGITQGDRDDAVSAAASSDEGEESDDDGSGASTLDYGDAVFWLPKFEELLEILVESPLSLASVVAVVNVNVNDTPPPLPPPLQTFIEELPLVFESEVLPRLNPTDLAMLMRAGRGCRRVVLASGLPRAGATSALLLDVSDFVGSVPALTWAKNNACPWNELTFGWAAYRGALDVVEWAHSEGCPW
jgi:hypothetical protein